MEIKIINKSKNESPKYSRDGDAGMDLRAMLNSPMELLPGTRALIPTGIHIQLPSGYEGQVRGRSGLAVRNGVTAILGTIDFGYKDGIGVILINHGTKTFTIENGMRIAQLVISKVEQVKLMEVEELDGEDRGGGFGSSRIELQKKQIRN